jgi:sodium-dependent dicarboxylate transporter 2/3/5
MGTLVGGGRTMVAAAFLKEFTGVEISFMDWIKYAMPMAIVTVPASVGVVYLVFRPDTSIKLPKLDDEIGPWSAQEKLTLLIVGLSFILWLTKGFHGLHYSVTGMLGVTALVVSGILKWDDVHENLEWGTPCSSSGAASPWDWPWANLVRQSISPICFSRSSRAVAGCSYLSG